MLGITDEPIKSFEQDTLNLEHYVAALLEFIKTTDTPMTIGVQGQWGSGKTSMLNSIKKHLDSENQYRQIWINSWELSILCTPEETLIKVIEEIVDELEGPLENSDLVGLNLTLDIHGFLLKELDNSAKPQELLRNKVNDGKLGMSTGEGFRKWTKSESLAARERLVRHLTNIAKRRIKKGS